MLKKFLAIFALLYASCAFAAVDANQATLEQLNAIKGIGPELSQRIIRQRNKSAFANWPDLIDRVHGIGNASAARFSENGLRVNGKVFQGGFTPADGMPPMAPPAGLATDGKRQPPAAP